ncbi:hypothetical protein ROHU_016111 [Labeo rohita]|uniref:CxC7-like cysteine cluster associated with KDZ transposases domain-containing protein n=1 Tax=Labeo rohita TaxID=84645 RepID=A0A498NLK8_LABRO|nr:hypothetical protein ROHU_016111 [Labeo rohita]
MEDYWSHYGFCGYPQVPGVVNWKAFSEEHRRTYRIPYRISCCILCKSLYKDCEVYRGCGQRGKLQGFYSDNEFAGYCSADCFYEAEGTL